MIETLIDKRPLRLVCVDEVHQFVMFGCTFRPEFSLLKDSLFKKIANNDDSNENSNDSSSLPINLKVLLLLMTATFNIQLLSILQKMIGIRTTPSTCLWSGRDEMQRRTARMSVAMTAQILKNVKVTLKELLSSNIDKK